MPHIRVRGLYESDVKAIAPKCVEAVADLTKCSPDHVTVEVIPTIWVEAAGSSSAYPFVEVHWFARSQEIQDDVAQAITDAVMDEGFEEVAVLFYELQPGKYYENGEHF